MWKKSAPNPCASGLRVPPSSEYLTIKVSGSRQTRGSTRVFVVPVSFFFEKGEGREWSAHWLFNKCE